MSSQTNYTNPCALVTDLWAKEVMRAALRNSNERYNQIIAKAKLAHAEELDYDTMLTLTKINLTPRQRLIAHKLVKANPNAGEDDEK